MFIKRLLRMPGRSALSAAVDDRDEWTIESYLIAEVLDRLEVANWLSIEINSEDNELPFPKPWPRPGVGETETIEDPPEFASLDEVANLFAMNTLG